MKRFYDRKPNRMPGYDYSSPGYYFVTTNVHDRVPVFGEINNNKMILNKFGQIVRSQWLWLKKQYSYIFLDEYIVMPDHFHGILEIIDDGPHVGSGRDLPLREEKIKSLSELIGAFKTTSSKQIHFLGNNEFRWQRSFYDRIVESDNELENIREYIKGNVGIHVGRVDPR